MTNLVSRLRSVQEALLPENLNNGCGPTVRVAAQWCGEAADEIERLEALVKRCVDGMQTAAEMRAVEPSGELEKAWCGDCGQELEAVRPGKFQHIGECRPLDDLADIVAAALKGLPDEPSGVADKLADMADIPPEKSST